MTKTKLIAIGAATVAAGSLVGCGGSSNSTAAGPPPPPAVQFTDTATVLAQAQQTSETAQPYQVDAAFNAGGTAQAGLTYTDTSDATTPTSVNGM
jgi:hypothetical protein